jgi:hypothetical protein
MSSPLLLIRRVVVKGDLSCDLRLDRGLNIVQAVPSNGDPKSTNRSGKTALIELIQHGLGKTHDSIAKWHFGSIINKLQTLWLEIEVNGEIFTIERSLRAINAAAAIRNGPYTSGVEKLPAELVSIEGMSSFLLHLLQIPEVSVKLAKGGLTPLSFRLLTRAFILHQQDSFGGILDKVIPEQRKADVIGFLSGITSLERFSIETLLSEVEVDLRELDTYFQSVHRFLAEKGIPTFNDALSQVKNAQRDLSYAQKTQSDIQQEIGQQATDGFHRRKVIGRIESLRSQLFGLKEEIEEVERNFIGLLQEEVRLQEVLASLKSDRRKSQRLRVSNVILNSVDFSICPRCLQDITAEMMMREQYARCNLCNRPLTVTSDALPRSMPRIEDIDLQIEEAEIVLKDIIREKEILQHRLEEIRVSEAEIGSILDRESQMYISPSVDRLLGQSHEVAQKEADLARAKELLSQARALVDIGDNLDQLRMKQASLDKELSKHRKPNKERLEKLRQIYADILKTVDFPNFRNCSIDTQKLLPNINNNLYSSQGAALTALATVCYHLALFELARVEDTFFPLMLVIDSPAAGDMNEESEDNLQHYLALLQTVAEQRYKENDELPNWQIILTTRRLISELDPYVNYKVSQPNQMLLRETSE